MLFYIRILFDVGIGVFGLYVAYTFYSQYNKENAPTVWQRLLWTARDSATILWSKFVFVLSAVVAQLDNFADLLGLPELKDFINKWIGNPQVISGVMLAIAAITIYARTRPSSSNPLPPPPQG